MIRILFADDHEMVRIGLGAYLSAQADMKVIAEANNGKVAIEKALDLRPDIILMDLVMDDMDGIEATKQIIKEWPEAKIIIVTSFIDDEKVYPALEAGATSYMLKTSKAREIADAIRVTYGGESVLEPEVTGKVMNRFRQKTLPHEELTPREMEILLLISEGQSNQDIADNLFISIITVETHRRNLLQKFKAKNMVELVKIATENKLL